eukprot:TRINITY_DN55635_c0_g1_i1.p1 TRINITY_DN55635_c0_g1~~TRINITY_DN55635_c0_g1_i1.p1  ORF type:complete len:179 (-),score=30.02 TRINITY_DN55635_c0_g1_i1:814-1350(-)
MPFLRSLGNHRRHNCLFVGVSVVLAVVKFATEHAYTRAFNVGSWIPRPSAHATVSQRLRHATISGFDNRLCGVSAFDARPTQVSFGFVFASALGIVIGASSRKPGMNFASLRRRAFQIDEATADAAAAAAKTALVKPGDIIPNIGLDKGFPPMKLMLGDFCRGKKVVLVGLPGAFTPT